MMRLWRTLSQLALLETLHAESTGPERQLDLSTAPPPPKVINHGFVFKTEPEFQEESFDIMYMTEDRSLLAPGYIFLSPVPGRGGMGAQIYDMDGHLVWHGGAQQKAQDFKACDFLGGAGDHLCLHVRSPFNVEAIWDNTYAVSREFRTGVDGEQPNDHEFNMLPGGRSYLSVVVKNKTIDFPDNPVQGENGTMVIEGCFQEVDGDTGKSLFEWCGLDHVNVWDTDLYLNVPGHNNNTSWKSGKGTAKLPWDYIHVNSADKYDGDYLVSSGHLDQIIKVAGPDNKHGVTTGSTLWKLGGKTGEFAMNLTFSKQHAIRVLSFNSTNTVVAILDNAWEGTNEPTSSASSGKIIDINNETMIATLLQQYDHPLGMLAEGQGGTQVLPNGNMFIGWGRIPEITEYAQDGTLLFHTRWGTHTHNRSVHYDASRQHHEASYRAVKHPWVGYPKQSPKLLLLLDDPQEGTACPIAVYMSWNGATGIDRWRISTSLTSAGPWKQGRTVNSQGFETKICLEQADLASSSIAMLWAKIEALNVDDRILISTIKAFGKEFDGLSSGFKALVLFVGSIEAMSFLYRLFWGVLETQSLLRLPPCYERLAIPGNRQTRPKT